ncbi:hypothetical protein [uncultured Oscillibacter sp.]|uniref:hypothetical protein n=1 Tax=uncultured Oscillibacter sp. TaxID=876091 RepID=UPI002619C80B|nr:hypothetical protein [uncultured Oscillibacter sp.]
MNESAQFKRASWLQMLMATAMSIAVNIYITLLRYTSIISLVCITLSILSFNKHDVKRSEEPDRDSDRPYQQGVQNRRFHPPHSQDRHHLR